ncbi:MAG TPA: AMP-binding protein [Actinomycetota bacterium]|nr:AMP-binding protein [Actinomycetota bacterium]
MAVGAAIPGAVDLEGLATDPPDRRVEEPVDPAGSSSPHTSGTTGRPKGVMLTHASVTWKAVNLLTLVDLRTG